MEEIAPAANDFSNIIKLQLRKPKAWNWELTTSKSSPHIALPTIQLYNSKGQLLIEAKDHGMKRLSWSNIDRSKRIANNQVQRCRSDIIKNPLINDHRKLNTEKSQQNSERHIKKSKSDVLQRNKPTNVSYQNGSLNYKQKMMNGEINIRSRAEILERLRKCSEESLKRAVADGYQNILNFRNVLPAHRSESDSHKDRKKSYIRSKSQYEKILDNEHKPDINHFTHKRYKTRTSSAGTLIIDESFNSGYRRRPIENAVITNKPSNQKSWSVLNENPNMLFQSSSASNVPDISSCNYIVQEPITPVRDNGNSRQVVNNESKREKRRTKLRRRHSIDSTSSSAAEKKNRFKRKDDTKGRINTINLCYIIFLFVCQINHSEIENVITSHMFRQTVSYCKKTFFAARFFFQRTAEQNKSLVVFFLFQKNNM